MEERHREGPGDATKWETLLAGKGMPGELGEDANAAALKERVGSDGTTDREPEIRRALQNYMMFRADARHGTHTQMAQTIAAELGIGLDEVDVDDAYIKSVEEEVAEAQRGLESIRDGLVATDREIHPKRLKSLILKQAGTHFPEMSGEVLEAIADRLAELK